MAPTSINFWRYHGAAKRAKRLAAIVERGRPEAAVIVEARRGRAKCGNMHFETLTITAQTARDSGTRPCEK